MYLFEEMLFFDRYYCPNCLEETGVKYPCTATIVVSPQAILQQWQDEVKKHAPSLKVLVWVVLLVSFFSHVWTSSSKYEDTLVWTKCNASWLTLFASVWKSLLCNRVVLFLSSLVNNWTDLISFSSVIRLCELNKDTLIFRHDVKKPSSLFEFEKEEVFVIF